jgi:hypothetical protein
MGVGEIPAEMPPRQDRNKRINHSKDVIRRHKGKKNAGGGLMFVVGSVSSAQMQGGFVSSLAGKLPVLCMPEISYAPKINQNQAVLETALPYIQTVQLQSPIHSKDNHSPEMTSHQSPPAGKSRPNQILDTSIIQSIEVSPAEGARSLLAPQPPKLPHHKRKHPQQPDEKPSWMGSTMGPKWEEGLRPDMGLQHSSQPGGRLAAYAVAAEKAAYERMRSAKEVRQC